jgi:hypothetical protein
MKSILLDGPEANDIRQQVKTNWAASETQPHPLGLTMLENLSTWAGNFDSGNEHSAVWEVVSSQPDLA